MKQIVLLGTAPASINLAPFGSPDWEIWSCSPGTYPLAVNNGVKFDKFFELHRWEPGKDWFSAEYVKFLEGFEGDVITTAPVPTVKNCKVLEWERLVKKFGPYNFTSSLAWMCAMAIEEKPDKIAFYGVDMASTTEYHDQRMGCQYFAMIAQSLGIEVGTPPESDLLCPPPLYGVCEQSHVWIKETTRARELSGRLQQAQEEVSKRNEEIAFLKGALDDQDWHLHSFIGQGKTLGNEFCSPVVPEVIAGQSEEFYASKIEIADFEMIDGVPVPHLDTSAKKPKKKAKKK